MMAGNQITSDSLTSNLAGMSKNQLYDIMSQMKTLIEQNQQQARQILVDNPALTRALFQAQIMLGMVQPPQVIPNIQQAPSQPPQQPAQPGQQLNAQASHLYPVHSQQEQVIPSQTHIPARKQLSNQPPLPIPPSSAPPQSQAMASQSLQSLQQVKGHPSSQMNPMSLPQSSQIHNIPQVSHHSAPTIPSLLQSPVPMVSGQSQHSLHTSGIPHLPLQPPLPPQPRPTSMQPFQHQAHSQMGSHMSYQPSGASQPHLPQPPFNSGAKPPGSIGSSFPQGQPPLPSQPPPHSLYQVGGSHLGTDFTNQANSSITSQAGSSMQVDRPAWMPGLQDNTAGGAQLPGPPPMPGQMGIGGQPPRPQQLTQEMEKALLQQVMSLTPEQINLLPPEQRQQVLQLQQMLR